ncbi:MAG: DUF4836 family protein [Prevotella sp.]|nr:DUF4836 family protein [Prevotella sp.]
MKRLLSLFSLLAAVLMLSSCGGGIPDYAKLIPKDAVVVFRFNAEDFYDASGLGDSDHPMRKKAERALKDSELKGKARDMAIKMLDDPEACGIDADAPIFVYVNPKDENDHFGVVGGIDSESTFTEFLASASGEKVQKSGDLSYACSGSNVIVFNDDWFFMGDAGYNWDTWEPNDPKDLIAMVKKRVDSDKESITGNEAFKQMCSKDGMAQVMVLGSLIEDAKDYMDRDARKALGVLNESGIDPANFALICDVEMSKGEAIATAEVIAVKEEGEKMLEKMDELAGGSDEGFFLRINFGFLKGLGQNAGGSDAVILGKVSELIKYIEIKYEGDCKGSLKLVSNDDSMTPLAKLLEIVAKFM